ncbi:MAG: LPD7 domain-containing protein, partial [bacterium]
AEPLYVEYQRQREAALQAREAARTQLRQDHARYTRELKAWYAERRQSIKENCQLTRAEKRTAYKQLARQRQADFRARRQLEAESRKAIAGAHPLPTWQRFLEDAAAHGDARALAVLRSRQQRQRQVAADLLTAEDAEAARHLVFAHLRPHARKNGEMVYHIADGGVVVDEARQVRVERLTVSASFLALALAEERFKGRALIVEGSEAFRREIVDLAALRGLEMRFADPTMEEERQRAAKTKAALSITPSPALEALISQRNELRNSISNILSHRAWQPGDAGEAIYQGRRRLSDGSEAVLLKRGDEMLVKAATRTQAAKASQWQVGQAVQLDDRGRLVDGTRRRKR